MEQSMDVDLDPVQEQEFRENWEPLGYGPNTFLNWYEIDGMCLDRYNAFGAFLRNPSDLTDFNKMAHHIEGREHICKVRMGVRFAEKWWDTVGGNRPDKAMAWHMYGFTPSEAAVCLKLRFQAPHRAVHYVRHLGAVRLGWMADHRVPCPKDIEIDDYDYVKTEMEDLAERVDSLVENVDRLSPFTIKSVVSSYGGNWEMVLQADIEMCRVGVGEETKGSILKLIEYGGGYCTHFVNELIPVLNSPDQYVTMLSWIADQKYRGVSINKLKEFVSECVPVEWGLASLAE